MAMEWMDDNREQWRWSSMVIFPPLVACPSKILVVFINGLELCEKVSEVLNQNGCICNLE